MFININTVIGLFFIGELFFKHKISNSVSLQFDRGLFDLFNCLVCFCVWAELALMQNCPLALAWHCKVFIDFVAIVNLCTLSYVQNTFGYGWQNFHLSFTDVKCFQYNISLSLTKSAIYERHTALFNFHLSKVDGKYLYCLFNLLIVCFHPSWNDKLRSVHSY